MSNLNLSSIDPRVAGAILRSDFYSFIQAMFPLLSPNGSLTLNWHLEALAYALSRVLDGEIRRLIITVPPRSLKSICASVMFPAFALGHNPALRIICASYAETLALALSMACRDVMRARPYRRLFPHTQIVLGRDNQMEFATTHGGTLTGRGGNFVIIDDPMKAQDTFSEAARESVWEWHAHTLISRLDNKAQDAIVLVMQRLHLDDLAGHLLEQGGWVHLNLPAIAESDHDVPVGPGRVYHRKLGDLLHADREPQSVLDEIKSAMGSMTFAAQYQQQPVARQSGEMAMVSLLRRAASANDGRQNHRELGYRHERKGACQHSVGVVVQVRGGTVHVLDVIRERLEYPELRRKVIALHRQWRSACNSYSLVIENKGSGMGLIQDLKREQIHAIGIDPVGDKIMRMNNQTGHIEAGAVFLPRRAPWLDDFRRELCAFPGGRYDDQVDAFSQALSRAFEPRSQIKIGAVRGIY